MNKFKDFNISTTTKSFTGDKIKISKVMNREIVVYDYRIEPSKIFKEKDGKCLYLQIGIGDARHVVFTSASGLIEAIQKVPKSNFPFTTTIVEENERFIFT